MKVEKMWDLFMFVNVPEGEHTYFFPAWMDYGLYLCGLACLVFVAVMMVWRKKSKISAVVADAPDDVQTPDISDQPDNAQTPDIPTESDAMQTLTVSDDVQTTDIPDNAQMLTVPDGIEKDTL